MFREFRTIEILTEEDERRIREQNELFSRRIQPTIEITEEVAAVSIDITKRIRVD